MNYILRLMPVLIYRVDLFLFYIRSFARHSLEFIVIGRANTITLFSLLRNILDYV